MGLKNSLLVILGVLTIISCTQKKTTDLSKVFRYNEYANVTTLDPAFAKDQRNIWVINQLYNGLVQLDDSLHIKPDIAKSWNIKNEGKTYEFTLRNDVYFHKHNLFGKDSTRTVTAQDFEYSLNRLLDKNTASPGGWVLQHVDSFKASNDSTFVINLKQSFPPFLGLLSMKYCSVVAKEAIDFFKTDYRENPIGTGPFYKKMWVENTKLVLRKNPIYFEKDNTENKLPYLEAVAITFLPDKQSEFLQFVQGNLDFMKSIDASYKDEIITAKGELQDKYEAQVNMQTGAYLNTEYLGFFLNDSDEPIQDKRIRKAINYGFDRKKMMTFLRNNIGTPAESGIIPKGLPSFNNQKGYTYNPTKAQKLVKDYVTETGNKNPKVVITTNSNYLDLCEFIQKELQNIGLDVQVDVVPPSTLRQAKANGKLSVFRASWIADYPDAENYLSLFYSKNFTPKGPNYTHFKNKEFDELYELAVSEVNTLKRYRLYNKMDSILIEEAPVVPLYYDQVVRFRQKNVEGLGINPIDILQLKKVKKTKN